MTCQHCTAARAGPHHGYIASCDGCKARMLAHSPQYWDAAKDWKLTRDLTPEYKFALEQTLGNVAAHEQVREWAGVLKTQRGK